MPPAHRLSRIQICAQNNPRRHAVIAGPPAGVLFGAAMAAMPLLLLREAGPVALPVGIALALTAGAFFGAAALLFCLMPAVVLPVEARARRRAARFRAAVDENGFPRIGG